MGTSTVTVQKCSAVTQSVVVFADKAAYVRGAQNQKSVPVVAQISFLWSA